MALKILLLCGLLCGLAVTTQSTVKEVVFPAGSRLTKTLVKLGLTEHIFPHFNSTLLAFKRFKSNEFTKMVTEKETVDKIKSEMVSMKDKLQIASKKFQSLQEKCFASLNKRCPICIFTACQKRAQSVCKHQLSPTEAVGKVFDPCNCPRIYPQCRVGRLICEKVGAVPDIIKGIMEGNGTVKDAGQFLVANVQALIDVAIRVVGNLETKTVPDFLVDGIGKFIEDQVFEDIGDIENFLTGDLIDTTDGLGGVVDDTASDLEDFVVGSTQNATDESWDTADEMEDNLDKETRDKLHKDWIIRHSIRKMHPRLWGKRSISQRLDSNWGGSVRNHHLQKRLSFHLPTCDDITTDNSTACEMYRYHPYCTKYCDAKDVCPTVETTHKRMESLNHTLTIAEMSYNQTAGSLQLANRRFKERFERRKRAFCWSQLLAKHYQHKPSRGWYNITKVVSFYDESKDQYLNVTATVDVGSATYHYQGNIIFQQGFNPMSNSGAKKIAEQALVWYKTKLTENKACSSL